MQAVYDHSLNVSHAFTSIQNQSGASEEFVYALFNGENPPPIIFLSDDKKNHVNRLISQGWEERHAIDFVTGRAYARQLFTLYKNEPANFFRFINILQN
jgi:hypothetical protein